MYGGLRFFTGETFMVPFCFIVAIETGLSSIGGDHCHPAFAYNYIFLSRSDINLTCCSGIEFSVSQKSQEVYTQMMMTVI